MNAKELIEAATPSSVLIVAAKDLESRARDGGSQPTTTSDLWLARHILSTVRPDDDEPVTRDWLEAEPGWRLFHADDRTVLFIHDAAGVNLAFSASRGADAYDAMWIGGFVKVKSLGHLRRLVAALGE